MVELPLNVSTVVYNDVTVANHTTDYFAIPARANLITWSFEYGSSISAAAVSLLGSLDAGVTSSQVDADSSNGSFTREKLAAAPFVAVKMGAIDAGVPVMIIIRPSYKRS